MQPGDRIAAWNGVPVWTYGDVQYRYDKVDRRAQSLEITVDRSGQSVDLTVELPPRWWWTDLRFRQSSVDPRLDFEDRPLTGDEKQKLGLKPDSFASQVKDVAEMAKIRNTHDLRVGDVIVGVDGVERDEWANTAELYLKLHTKAGAATYAARKGIVEPVIGQIKQARGFRQFLLRGFEMVQGEWSLVCTTHNIFKLYRLCL